MAVTAGTGGSGTVDTTGDYIFDVAGTENRHAGATSMQIWNEDATNAAEILVTGLHDSGEELSLPPSRTTVVRFTDQGLRQIHVKAAASTVEVHWGIVARS